MIARIRLTGHIDVAPERRADVTAALPEHIRLTRGEPGCLLFEVTPDPKVEGRWQVAELFVDRAAFDTHQARTAASNWATVSDGIPRSYVLEEIAP